MSLQVTLKSKTSLFTYLHRNEDELEARAFCASHYPDYKVVRVDVLHSEERNMDMLEIDALGLNLTH